MVAVTGAVVGVAGSDLLEPRDAAVGESERDDGVARLGDGLGVVVAGRDVEEAARRVTVGVDHTATPEGPYTRAPRAFFPALAAHRSRTSSKLRAVAHAHGDDAAAECAAWIIGIAARDSSHDDTGTSAMPSCTVAAACQPRRVVRLELKLPDECAARSVEA